MLHYGNVHVQIDVDIGSSTVANGVLGLVCGVITTLVVDMAFLVQVSLIYSESPVCAKKAIKYWITRLSVDLNIVGRLIHTTSSQKG
jgi:hypothetical protein